MIAMKNGRVPSNNRHIEVDWGGSGWFAVLVVTDDEGFKEPWQTGVGRYATREEAVKEAIGWSISDEIPCDVYLPKKKRK